MSASKSKIFLLDEQSEDLTPLVETLYEKEADLQQFLARYPDLLPGDRIAGFVAVRERWRTNGSLSRTAYVASE